MEFNVQKGVPPERWWTTKVGNVYLVGQNGKAKDQVRLRVLVGKNETHAFFLIINPNGDILATSQIDVRRLEIAIPVGFVQGLDDLKFNVTPVEAKKP